MTATNTNVTLTPEQCQTAYVHLLENLQDDSTVAYEECQAAFAQAAAESGYDYAARWKLEPVLQAEHLARFLSPAAALLKLLVEGQATLVSTQAHLGQYAADLAAELVRQKPWEHRCTCPVTNVAALCQATAKAEAVEKIQKISYRLRRFA
jgi:hypothetical protein